MKTSQKSGKAGILKEVKDSFENLGDDFLANLRNSAKSSAADINSQLFGSYSPAEDDHEASRDSFSEEFLNPNFRQEKKEPKRIRKTEIVFNYLEKREQHRLSSEISQLMDSVKTEIEMLKMEDKSLVNDISKLSINEMPKNPGIYHLRFLEFIIRLLRTIRQKISEGRLWLQTTSSKRMQKKFRHLAKTKGTKFSMSNELTQANTPG